MVRIVSVGGVAKRVAAALPAIAIATTGIAFATSSSAPEALNAGPTGITIPDLAQTEGASPLYPAAGPAPAPMQLPPIYQTYTSDPTRIAVPTAADPALHAIAAMAPVRLDVAGIPAPALAAYQRASDLLSRIDPGCGIDWALLGAIGRVESNHSRFGGNALDASGIARPGIIGIPLDGSRGTAHIGDSDNGVWDRDTVYDRAVGPMQFIPGTWRISGQDADGDGVRNPQSMADAAAAAGSYLCSGSGNLADPQSAYNAIMRYNHSDSYVRTVMSIADAYRGGVTVLPMGALPAARPASGTGDQTPDGSGFGWGGSAEPQPSATPKPAPSATPTKKPAPSATPKPSPTSSPSGTPSQPSEPAPNEPAPSQPGLPLPVPTLPLPSVPLPTVPLPTLPLPTTSLPSIADLLKLPPLPPLLGDPLGMVRVLSPLTGQVVCLLDSRIVKCPGLLG